MNTSKFSKALDAIGDNIVASIDRQLIAGEMTEIMRDESSGTLTLSEIKALAIMRLIQLSE